MRMSDILRAGLHTHQLRRALPSGLALGFAFVLALACGGHSKQGGDGGQVSAGGQVGTGGQVGATDRDGAVDRTSPPVDWKRRLLSTAVGKPKPSTRGRQTTRRGARTVEDRG
jgi:hypothetical protein